MRTIGLTPVNDQSTLTDGFGRRFNYLRLSITEACNFRCNYCLPEGYCPDTKEQPLTVDEIRRLVSTMSQLGTLKIRITGGEPTLRKDLVEIVEVCASTPGIEQVALTSNGYRLAQQLPDLAKAGLTALNLSADSLDPRSFQTITGHDKLTAVLNALDLSTKLGLKTKLNSVLMQSFNANEISNFVRFVKDRPISLRLIELMRTNDNAEFYQQQHVSATGIRDTLINQGWLAQNRSQLAGPAEEFTHADYTGSIGLIMPYSKNFCADCNRLRIAANGNLHLCLFNEANSNIRRYLGHDENSAFVDHLQQVVLGKWQGHQLENNYSGTTSQLAMLGG